MSSAKRVDGFSRTPAMVVRRLEQALGGLGLQPGPQDQALSDDRMVDGAKDVGFFHDRTVAPLTEPVSRTLQRNIR